MKCDFSLFLTALKLFTTEYKSSVVQLEKYCRRIFLIETYRDLTVVFLFIFFFC